MKKALLFVLALAVIPVGVDAQVTPSASCADINGLSPLEDVRPCAEQGDAEAQYRLGRMYAIGSGSLPEDFVESVRWYRLAAEQGHGGAQTSLGFRYRYGRGVPEDDVEAVRWFRLASEQGNAEAQYSLGTLYAGGEGVPEDHVRAYMWFNLAAAQGNEDAESGKAGIERRMTREQIAEAQRLSTEWYERLEEAGEDLNVRLEGLRRDYPQYYNNIIRQIQRCFGWSAAGNWQTTLAFTVGRDGLASDIDFLTRSGNTAFDSEAMGAVDCARFGELPEDYPFEGFRVNFTFSPSG